MLEGLMQNDFPLTLDHIRRRMRMFGSEAQVATLGQDGAVARATFGE